jgi:hypothetical protein
MQVVFWILAILSVVVLIVGLVNPAFFVDKKTGEVPKRKEFAIGSIGLFIFSLVMISALGDEPESKALPNGSISDRIKAISANVTEVSEVGDSLSIVYFQSSILDGDHWIITFSHDAFEILKRFTEATHNKPYKKVVFFVRVPTRDNLGHESDSLGMKVFYDMVTLAQAKYENMTPFDLLEIPAEIQFNPVGRKLASSYCTDDSHEKFAPRFCSVVLGE